MSQLDKLITKMKQQPNGITPDEAQKVLNAYGYRLDRQKGSHMQFINLNGDVPTILKKTPLRAVYVKSILGRIGEEV